jgi:phage major head subunit gpT-like protein
MANYTPVSVLDLTVSDLYQQGYSVAEPWSDQVVTTMPSKGAEVLVAWLDKIPSMRKWVGNRVMNHANIRTYSVINEKWENSVAMDRAHVEDNQLGLYAQALKMLGDHAAKWKDRVNALKIKENPVGFDGVPFFSASHPVDLDNPVAGGTYSNVVASAANLASAYNAAVALGAGFTGADGESMGFTITHVLTDGEHVVPLNMFLNQAFVPNAAGTATQSNPFVGIAKGVTANELNLTAAEKASLGVGKYYVYFLDLSKGISPFVFSERDTPELQMLGTQGAYDAGTDLYKYGYRARGAATVSMPFLAIRAVVDAPTF